MHTKRKLIIAISAFAMVLLAGIVAVVAVLAAQSVTVRSNVNVSYESVEFIGTIDASYQVKNGTSTPIGSQVSFTGAENENAEKSTEATPNITLTKTNNEVTFSFTFKTAEVGYKAKLTSLTENASFTIAYGGVTGFTGKNVDFDLSTATAGVTPTITYTLNTFNADISNLALNFTWSIHR